MKPKQLEIDNHGIVQSTEIDFCPLCSTTGWALETIVEWLLSEGRRLIDPAQFADELCRRLVAAGAPLWLMRFKFGTLHPQVSACAFTWVRGKDSTEYCLLHEIGNRCIDHEIEKTGQTDKVFCYRLDQLDPDVRGLLSNGETDHIIVPLRLCTHGNSEIVFATKDSRCFSDQDIAKLVTLSWFLAPIIEVLAMRRVTRSLLDTYLGHRSGSKVLDGLVKRGDGESITATVWYCDLRDFTLLTETLSQDMLLNMLNSYFEYVTDAVAQRGGEVLRFIGDAMLIVFPGSRDGHNDDTCQAAVEAATDCLEGLPELNKSQSSLGVPAIKFGIGLHFGEVIYGNVGARDRLDFTVMGSAVNRAARLEDLTKRLGVPLLLSTEIVERINGYWAD